MERTKKEANEERQMNREIMKDRSKNTECLSAWRSPLLIHKCGFLFTNAVSYSQMRFLIHKCGLVRSVFVFWQDLSSSIRHLVTELAMLTFFLWFADFLILSRVSPLSFVRTKHKTEKTWGDNETEMNCRRSRPKTITKHGRLHFLILTRHRQPADPAEARKRNEKRINKERDSERQGSKKGKKQS